MKKTIRLSIGMVLCLIMTALTARATDDHDYHVVKSDRSYDQVIHDPYEWALEQFADGPIRGTNVSEYGRIVATYGLKQALADLGNDGSLELFLSQDWPHTKGVLVFTPVKGGYRYIGQFAAWAIAVIKGKEKAVRVYERCGGHNCYIHTYVNRGSRFVCDSTEALTVGDGAPPENNQRVETLFPSQDELQWTKTRPTKESSVPGTSGTPPAGQESRR